MVEHRSATRMRHVDALSRIVMQIDNRFLSVVKECQQRDEHLKTIVKLLEQIPYEDYEVKGGVLMKSVMVRQ